MAFVIPEWERQQQQDRWDFVAIQPSQTCVLQVLWEICLQNTRWIAPEERTCKAALWITHACKCICTHMSMYTHAHIQLLRTEITDLRPSHKAWLGHEKTQRAASDKQHVEVLTVHYQIGLSQEMSNWHSFMGPTCGPHAACVPRGLWMQPKTTLKVS